MCERRRRRPTRSPPARERDMHREKRAREMRGSARIPLRRPRPTALPSRRVRAGLRKRVSMKIERAMIVLAVAAAYPLAGCQVYVDEPAKHPAPPPPPPAAQQAAPAAPKEVKVAPMHLHGAGVTPAAPPAGGGAAPVA